MRGWLKLTVIGGALISAAIGAAEARITRIDIIKTEPAFGGESFGDAGAYERLTARVHGALDPADPANSIIQDRRSRRATWRAGRIFDHCRDS